MNVIILDIDGVLNSRLGKRTIVQGHGCLGVEDVLLKRFQNLLKKTDANIVLCSTWRKYDDLVKYLGEKIGWGSRYIGNTGTFPWWSENCPYPDERQAEVEKWLEEHPEVVKWVCIDDSVYPVLRPNGLIINPNNDVGITEKQAYQAVKFLNG